MSNIIHSEYFVADAAQLILDHAAIAIAAILFYYRQNGSLR